jgi:hypothetical protein
MSWTKKISGHEGAPTASADSLAGALTLFHPTDHLWAAQVYVEERLVDSPQMWGIALATTMGIIVIAAMAVWRIARQLW